MCNSCSYNCVTEMCNSLVSWLQEAYIYICFLYDRFASQIILVHTYLPSGVDHPLQALVPSLSIHLSARESFKPSSVSYSCSEQDGMLAQSKPFIRILITEFESPISLYLLSIANGSTKCQIP